MSPSSFAKPSYFQKRDTFPTIRNNDKTFYERRLGCMEPKDLTLSLHSRLFILALQHVVAMARVRCACHVASIDPEWLGNKSRLDGRLASDIWRRA